jgi:hypothetical protein
MTAVKPASNVCSVATDDGAVLLDLGTGKFFGLNPTAAVIWAELATGKDMAALVPELASRFEVGEERMKTDIRELVEVLRRHRLSDERRTAK